MRKTICSLVVPVLATLVFSLGTALAQPTLVLLDDFEDDTAGSPPNGPSIGSATYGSGSVDYEVVNIGGGGGGKLLRCEDDSISEAISINYTPSSAPDIAEISYDFMIYSNSTLVGPNAFAHEFRWDNDATSFHLLWGENDKLRFQEFHEKSPYSLFIDTGFDWHTATTYELLIQVDATTDTVNVLIDGAPVVTNYILGQDVSALTGLYFGDNATTDGTMRLDNVQITPEPATLGLLALGGLGLLRRRRRHRTT